MEFDCKNPATVADSLTRTVCVKKTQQSLLRLAILGLFAGVYIGFGAQLATMVSHDVAAFLGVPREESQPILMSEHTTTFDVAGQDLSVAPMRARQGDG